MSGGESQPIIEFLRSEGGAGLPHARGQTLLDHLIGTYWIVRRWGQPAWLQHAALIHSVYGTDAYREPLLSPSRRNELVAVAGDQAERIAWLFGVTPRRPLFAGTHLWARDLPTRLLDGKTEMSRGDPPTRDELDAVLLLHMANLAEQAHTADGRPGRWLVRIRDLAELIVDSESVRTPAFVAHLADVSEIGESFTCETYLKAVSDDGDGRADGFALAAAGCAVVPEPCVWQAYLSSCRGDSASTRSWAAQGFRRLAELGTAWDRRLSFEEWLTVVEALENSTEDGTPPPAGGITHPRALLETIKPTATGSRIRPRAEIAPPAAEAGRRRFERYVEGLAGADGSNTGAVYPNLPSQPWHDSEQFALVSYLESHYDTIREETLALEGVRFHRESERIGRSGDWDVAFLYERGRRHDDICVACPVTARGIDAYPAMRTVAGLIYVSRMRASTHIAAHRGPTNLRVRCHLPIKVPDGDCAIRVGDQTRPWQEGKCLVFDDYFVHEAWNHTDEDRIVLIVDLWHPGLSPTEVMLLQGLHEYAYFNAQKLNRYWSANAAATRQAAGH